MQKKITENSIIPICITEANALAVEYFIKICGFNREGEKNKRLLARGMEIREKIRDKVDIRAVISSFSGSVLYKNTAVLSGITFECNVFQRLNPSHTLGVYAYILTAGSFELDDSTSVLDQLYADIWGTAYVDAGIEILRGYVEKDLKERANEREFYVLGSFGPGSYGMDVNQVGNFFGLLDGDRIGVKVKNSSLILPLKSSAGFFVGIDEKTSLPASDCKSCRAENKNCTFCQLAIKKNE